MNERPMQFLNIKKKEEKKPSRPIPWGKVAVWFLGIVIGVLLVYFVIIQTIGFYSKLANSWNEIIFAYQHPALVKSIRVQYQVQEIQLESSLLQKQPLH